MENIRPISRKIIKSIETESKKYFIGSSGCHDWTHIDRVRRLAIKIGKKEKADLGIIEIAALLHDIGRKEEMKCKGIFCHAQKSFELAGPILRSHSLSEKNVSEILHCIKSHRFRANNINNRPSSLEAKILFDADKLDSIGAVGVARDFLFAGNAGSGNLYTGNEKRQAKLVTHGKDFSFTKEDSAVLEYEIKLKYLKNKLLTQTGRELGKRRHKFMEIFFKRFWKEVMGVI